MKRMASGSCVRFFQSPWGAIFVKGGFVVADDEAAAAVSCGVVGGCGGASPALPIRYKWHRWSTTPVQKLRRFPICY